MTKEISFFEKVYDVVRRIPQGKVTTYGAIAKTIGSPQASRMVGYALNALHGRDDVPAHRVVNRRGMLSGKSYFQGTHLMQQLLENEGIKVENNAVKNFEDYFWNPQI